MSKPKLYFWGWDAATGKPIIKPSHPHSYGSRSPHEELFWVWECGSTRAEQAAYIKKMGLNPNRLNWFASKEEWLNKKS